jgi:hypothetical protein
MPACSSRWEAQRGGGTDEAQCGRGLAGKIEEGDEVAGRHKPARFSHAKPVSNRHPEELAR